jgi:glycosyltransferase involved in cell wall biosynthesis
MKVVVYTICKNESKFVNSFMDCLSEADAVYVTDTGSTDNTVDLLRARGAIVNEIVVNPWRFDVARNISLSFVPPDVDICVCIDLDEVLTPGWRKAVEAAWTENVTRLRYQYAWSHDEQGNPAVTFWYDKIHKRNGYRWVKPVHEVLQLYNETEVQSIADGFMLHHWPDASKSRSSYLGLLELAVKEEPHDDRSAHYLGREYMFHNMYSQAIDTLKRHLLLPSATWHAERSASMRFISRSYLALNNHAEALSWGLRACAEAPKEREPWVDLANVAYKQHDMHTVYFAASKALEIKERPMSYICEPFAWGAAPYDFLTISAHALGHLEEAVAAASEAVRLEPTNERLRKNLLAVSNELQFSSLKKG